jgi:protein-tyrosine-phosphatase
MAEALFKARMPTGWEHRVEASSAGMAALEGGSIAPLAAEVLRSEGIDLSAHRARMVTREMVEGADLIVVMEGRHCDAINRIAPGAAARIILFGELDGTREDPDIEDPIGGDRAAYERTKNELEGLVARLIDRIAELYELAP